ncbi:MAG: glycoside hydrolase family 18 protein [Ktedonobacterales bacterium]
MRPRLGGCARILLAACVGALLVSGGTWLWLNHTETAYTGPHFNQGHNAIWLEHSWAGGPHPADAYDQLAVRLAHEQIRYVFAHVGPLDSTGAIPAELAPNAATLVQQLKMRLPGVRVLAWIGQVERASGAPPDQSVDLADSNVRNTIALTAARFAGPLGFDGVHFDIEPMINNNPRFLDLLDETRAALPAGRLLSISAPMWAPNAHAAEWLRTTVGHGAGLWTSYYYAAVASHVDQLVVMGYNTALPAGLLYRVDVKQQTQHILEAVRSARHPPEVLVGLPTYHENGLWFHDAAENLSNGIAGIVAGLNSDPDDQPFAGIAIYRYAVTSDADWTVYDRLWLGSV